VTSCPALSIANADGAHDAVRHLMQLGHRRIAILRGPQGNVDARERLKGYRRALREGGAETDAALEIRGDFTQESGYGNAGAVLALSPRPTAVFAANDYMAIGLIRAFSASGVRVPEDIAVAGFDDIELARYVAPPLTTVHVGAYELGERAVRIWFERIGGRKRRGLPLHEVLPTTLVVRGSCGAAPRPRSAILEAVVRESGRSAAKED
jgi:LacI family transcriptional regulator